MRWAPSEWIQAPPPIHSDAEARLSRSLVGGANGRGMDFVEEDRGGTKPSHIHPFPVRPPSILSLRFQTFLSFPFPSIDRFPMGNSSKSGGLSKWILRGDPMHRRGGKKRERRRVDPQAICRSEMTRLRPREPCVVVPSSLPLPPSWVFEPHRPSLRTRLPDSVVSPPPPSSPSIRSITPPRDTCTMTLVPLSAGGFSETSDHVNGWISTRSEPNRKREWGFVGTRPLLVRRRIPRDAIPSSLFFVGGRSQGKEIRGASRPAPSSSRRTGRSRIPEVQGKDEKPSLS